MAEQEQQVEMSKRDKMLERLRSKYPDKKFEDDEETYGQIGEDYDNYENEMAGYKEREQSIGQMFKDHPQSASFLVALSKGENPVTSLVKHFGPDIKAALDDPQKLQEVADAWAKEQERIAKSNQLDEEWAKNTEQSLEVLDQYAAERGLDTEHKDAIFNALMQIVNDGLLGKFSVETFDMISKAINHDQDVEIAQQEGTVAGKNSKYEEKLRKREKGDGIAPLSGKNNAGGKGVKGRSIFDVAGDANSPW